MNGFAPQLSDADKRNVSAWFASQAAKPAFARNKDTLELGQRIWRARDLLAPYGVALTDDPALARRMAMLRSHGLVRDPADMTEPPEGPWVRHRMACIRARH